MYASLLALATAVAVASYYFGSNYFVLGDLRYSIVMKLNLFSNKFNHSDQLEALSTWFVPTNSLLSLLYTDYSKLGKNYHQLPMWDILAFWQVLLINEYGWMDGWMNTQNHICFLVLFGQYADLILFV